MTSLLHVHGERNPRISMLDELRATGVEVRSTAADASATPGSFDVVLISADVAAPIQVASSLHRRAPEAHIVFLTTRATDHLLRSQLNVSSHIGQQWSIAPSDAPAAAADIVRQAIIGTERRKKLRTAPPAEKEAGLVSPRRVLISDQFLSSILDQLSDAVVVLDRSSGLLALNQAARRAFGALPRGSSFLSVCPPAVADAVRAASEGQLPGVEVVFDGMSHEAAYALRATPLLDDTGEVIGIGIVARDTTAGRQLEEMGRFSEEVLSAVTATSSPDALLQQVTDALVEHIGDLAAIDLVEGAVTRRRAFGARTERELELIAALRCYRPVDNRWHPAVAAVERGETVVLNEVGDDVLQQTALNDDHLQLLRQLGAQAFVTAPLRAGNETIGAVTVARTTADRFAPEEVRIVRDMALQTTTALHNIWAHQAATQAGRARDEFLATLSHELRTPLTSILGWAQILCNEGADSKLLMDGLAAIEQNARSQAFLIDELLDLSQIGMGKRFDSERVSLSDVARAAADAITPAARAREVALVLELSDPGWVHGDADRLRQLIGNLLSNAVKFSSADGEIRIEVATKGEEVSARVIDRGQGIEPAFLPHVFDRFRQAENVATRQFGGLGLGLAIVKQIVELHGGTIRAESRGVGKGATFTVLLPKASTL